MDFDDAGASRRLAREREARAAVARARRGEEAAARLRAEEGQRQFALQNERRHVAAAAKAERKSSRALEQARLTGGIRWRKVLRAVRRARACVSNMISSKKRWAGIYIEREVPPLLDFCTPQVPTPRDGDRVELPESALAQLQQLGALDASTPLAFELELAEPGDKSSTRGARDDDDDDDDVEMEEALDDGDEDLDGARETGAARRLAVTKTGTHAGVESFVAEEGTIGLPPKTMLSLVRGDSRLAASAGIDWEYLRWILREWTSVER